MTKYWFVLAFWFFSPLIISNVSSIQITFDMLIFGFVLPYWLFIMISFVYEGNRIMAYVKTHFPYEYKKRRADNTLDYKFFVTFVPPQYDERWKIEQMRYKKFIHFVFFSLLSIACFGLIYLTLFITS